MDYFFYYRQCDFDQNDYTVALRDAAMAVAAYVWGTTRKQHLLPMGGDCRLTGWLAVSFFAYVTGVTGEDGCGGLHRSVFIAVDRTARLMDHRSSVYNGSYYNILYYIDNNCENGNELLCASPLLCLLPTLVLSDPYRDPP